METKVIKFESVQVKVDEARESLINFIKQYKGTEVDIQILEELQIDSDNEDNGEPYTNLLQVTKIDENGIIYDWEMGYDVFEDYWNLSTNELYTIAHYLNYKM